MARQLWIADALTNAGLHVIEEPGWRARGKETFNPRGVVAHHTASNRTSGDIPSLKVVIGGRPDLPGPLCHVLIGRSGACHVIASGVANHAGPGGWKGLQGNSSVLGIEAENDGIGEPWSPHLVDVFERCAAALARGLQVNAGAVCGHKEWAPKRKIDPAGIDMDGFRKAVASLLKPAPTPTPEPEEPPMALLVKKKGDPRVLVTGDYVRARHVQAGEDFDTLKFLLGDVHEIPAGLFDELAKRLD